MTSGYLYRNLVAPTNHDTYTNPGSTYTYHYDKEPK